MAARKTKKFCGYNISKEEFSRAKRLDLLVRRQRVFNSVVREFQTSYRGFSDKIKIDPSENNGNIFLYFDEKRAKENRKYFMDVVETLRGCESEISKEIGNIQKELPPHITGAVYNILNR